MLGHWRTAARSWAATPKTVIEATFAVKPGARPAGQFVEERAVGHRGGWLMFGARGTRATVGVPGTGLFWTERIPPAAPPSAAHRVNFGVAALMVIVVLFALAGESRSASIDAGRAVVRAHYCRVAR